MLSDVLKQLVLTKGKTQKEIASDLGLIQQRFNFYVTGHREPDAEMLSTLADYFDVSVDYLLGRTDKKEKPTLISEGGPSIMDDEELIRRLCALPPEDATRVRDFVQGLIAARKAPPSQGG